MPAEVVGLDIGGANLKAAKLGRARSQAFPLWKSPDRLGAALRELLDGWNPDYLAVTMTGELCDCFATKREGIDRILTDVERAFEGVPIGVWSTRGTFVSAAQARKQHLQVAAANWHALATMAGRSLLSAAHSALMIDTGSTTTDIIPLWMGEPIPAGLTDPQRLRSSELVYTGVKRTPVCALVSEGVAAEYFATTHDVYLRLGMTADDPDCYDTADGRPATAAHAHGRLSRMLGGDPEITPESATDELARDVYSRQRKLLAQAIGLVAGRLPEPPRAVLVSGSGEMLASTAWADYLLAVHRDETKPISLARNLGPEISGAACAHAVATMAEAACYRSR